MRRLVRSLRSAAAALTLSVLAATFALAASGGAWTVAVVNGPVVYRAGDSWREVDTLQSLSDPFIRTLTNGAVRLERGPVSIALGSESIADVSSSDGGIAVLQYDGEVAIATSGNRTAAVRLDGGGIRVRNIAGVMSLIVSDRGAQVTVYEGSVHVVVEEGADQVLHSGSTMISDSHANTITVAPLSHSHPDVAIGLLTAPGGKAKASDAAKSDQPASSSSAPAGTNGNANSGGGIGEAGKSEQGGNSGKADSGSNGSEGQGHAKTDSAGGTPGAKANGAGQKGTAGSK